jgi:uncharacterized protein (DUF885 family)
MEKTKNNVVATTQEKSTWANPSLEGDPGHKLQVLLTHREKNWGKIKLRGKIHLSRKPIF